MDYKNIIMCKIEYPTISYDGRFHKCCFECEMQEDCKQVCDSNPNVCGNSFVVENKREDIKMKTYRCLVNRHVMEAVPGAEFIIIPGWPNSQAVPVEEATPDQLEKYQAHKAVPLLQPCAVLSTTVLPLDGTYEVVTIDPERVDITGVPHYIGHPATKNIVEKMGAVQAESKLFAGLEPGEMAVCFSIKQGKSTRAKDGFTSPHQDVSICDITCRVIRRLYVWVDTYGISVTTHPGGRYIEVEK